MKQFSLFVALLILPMTGAFAEKLPLPLTGSSGRTAFEDQVRPDFILVGLEIPARGPLTSWAPLWAPLQADGTIGSPTPGPWHGPVPNAFQSLTNPGSVVGGFRFLLTVENGTVQTRQAQVFWTRWSESGPGLSSGTSLVLGEKAGADDATRVVEIRVPEGMVATGFFGELNRSQVAQVSLLVKTWAATSVSTAPQTGPGNLSENRIVRPQTPEVPVVSPPHFEEP